MFAVSEKSLPFCVYRKNFGLVGVLSLPRFVIVTVFILLVYNFSRECILHQSQGDAI